ncbi:MAG TPA: hypothetical protein VF148_13470 [Acidimicrobiia bacterium]
MANEPERTIIREIRYGSLSLAVRMRWSGSLVRRLIAALGPADRQALTHPEATKAFQEIVREAFAQWGRAAVMKAGLIMRPWDFDPSRVTQEVRLWHGADDTRIPARVATAFAERMPHASQTPSSAAGCSWVAY